MFLLVPAYPGCPGSKAVKWLSSSFALLEYSRFCCCIFTSKAVTRIYFWGVRGIGGGRGQWLGGHHGECGARAYNRGLGAEPPAGSRGKAPGQGGEAPLKLKAF